MSIVVPDAQEIEIITAVLTPALTMKLYSNNVTPAHTDTAGLYTEVTGGGYVSKALAFASWSIVSGDPTQATYAVQTWVFTGATGGPGTIYGYFVTRNSDGKLMWAERFPSATVPFVPVAGSQAIVLPRYSVQSEF